MERHRQEYSLCWKELDGPWALHARLSASSSAQPWRGHCEQASFLEVLQEEATLEAQADWVKLATHPYFEQKRRNPGCHLRVQTLAEHDQLGYVAWNCQSVARRETPHHRYLYQRSLSHALRCHAPQCWAQRHCLVQRNQGYRASGQLCACQPEETTRGDC